MFAYNTQTHESTKYSPSELLFGFQPTFDLNLPISTPYAKSPQNYLQHRANTYNVCKANIANAVAQQAKFYNKKRLNPPTFKPGDKVWLVNSHIPSGRPSAKLAEKRLGPFPIISTVGNRAYKLKLPTSLSQTHPVFNVELLEPFHENRLRPTIQATPDMTYNGGKQPTVIEILQSRKYRNALQYKVRYANEHHPRWTNATILKEYATKQIKAFHEAYPYAKE